MKTKAAVATAARSPLEIMTVDLDGPRAGEVLVDGWLAYACEVFPDLAEVDRG